MEARREAHLYLTGRPKRGENSPIEHKAETDQASSRPLAIVAGRERATEARIARREAGEETGWEIAARHRVPVREAMR